MYSKKVAYSLKELFINYQNLHISSAECMDFIQNYFKIWPLFEHYLLMVKNNFEFILRYSLFNLLTSVIDSLDSLPLPSGCHVIDTSYATH